MAEGASAPTGPPPDVTPGGKQKPTVVLVIGMAGSGKTTLMQRINAHVHQHKIPAYIINLDPAVHHLPYEPNIDIRDTVNYKNVMKEYKLGPNGAILTSMNLFATRFDQVLALCEKERDPQPKYIFVDTPGQIEVFTWSASGAIITEALASSLPTMVLFVVDTPRCTAPRTFMSNMLQACSILYKSRLPLLVAFNKSDLAPTDFAIEWMRDYDVFSEALDRDESYAATLSRSLALVLDEFYSHLNYASVSALTGLGVDEVFAGIDAARGEYFAEYVPELQKLRAQKDERERERVRAELEKLRADAGAGGTPAGPS
ncbi:unnamed protein product [Pedinophyceae sp. YPF-701]|nr:unnamed protein product [Pedinophyceae sp. YPF-701]